MERCCDPRNSTTSAITCRGYKLLECSRAIFVVSTRLLYLLVTRTIFDRVLIDPSDLCPVCLFACFQSATRALYSWLHQGVGSAYSDFGQVLFHAHLSKGTIVSNITCLSQAAILFINRLLSLIIQTTYIYTVVFTRQTRVGPSRERGIHLSLQSTGTP